MCFIPKIITFRCAIPLYFTVNWPGTDYSIAVVAVNVEKQAYASTGAKTEDIPMPEVTVSLREGSIAEHSFSFFITSTEADVLKWVCIEDGSRDVTAAQVIANGAVAEANVESEVVVDNLEPNTLYAVYAAATCDIEGFEPVISEKLVIKTAEPPPNYIAVFNLETFE